MDKLILYHPEQNFDKLKSKGVSISAFLDTVRPRKDGTYTIRFRLIHNRFPKYYSTKLKMSLKEWEQLIGKRPSGETRNKKVLLFEAYRKALNILDSMEVFSFDEFTNQFTRKDSKVSDLFGLFDEMIKELESDGRVGSKVVYEYSQASLKYFIGKSTFSFDKITVKFLTKYEKYMILKGKSPTTVAMYLRCVRHLCNKAIRYGIMKPEAYPFSTSNSDMSGYKMPEPRNNKIALTIDDIGKIFRYQSEDNSPEHFYRDMWLFSYLCNGINMKDICLLKYHDIQGDHIFFRRAKTQRTDRKSRPVDVILTDEVRKIMDRWGNMPISQETYIFPFLEHGLTPEKEQALIKQATKQTNKYIKRVAEKIGIKQNVHFQVARHSYATVLKRSGVSVEYISESLGHKNLSTTNNYLASFEDDQKKETAKHLTAFRSKEKE